MQLVFRGVSHSPTSSSTQNSIQLCYRGVKYSRTCSSAQNNIELSEHRFSDFAAVSSVKNNIELSYRGVRYWPMSSKAIGELISQKLTYRGITYYSARAVDTDKLSYSALRCYEVQ